MISYFFYLLEAGISLALFYLIYLLLVKDDTFYQLKRFYLLGSIILALLIPKLPSANWTSSLERTVVPQRIQNVQNPIAHNAFETIVITTIPNPANFNLRDRKPVSFLSVLFLFYLVGAGFMFFRLSSNLFQIFNLVGKHDLEQYRKYIIVKLNNSYPTFSFFRYIFLNEHGLSNEDRTEILFHEETHIKQGHSFDILFIEICKILLWFNPIMWLYKNSLVKVHECLVDECVIGLKSVDIINYQSLLLTQYLSNIKIELAQPFNYSFIKFRIKMMTKTKSKWWAKFKLVLALPVIILSLLAFTNCHKKASKVEMSYYEGSYNSPVGWNYGPTNNIKVLVENQISQHGQKCASLESSSHEFKTLMSTLCLKKFTNKRIKMTGYIKSQGVNDTATMWVRVDDYIKLMSTDFDNMYDRPIVGTSNWRKCEIIFDVSEKCCVFYGFIIKGIGKIWVDNVSFEMVSNDVRKTAVNLNQTFPPLYLEQVRKFQKGTEFPEKPPVNLDFEE